LFYANLLHAVTHDVTRPLFWSDRPKGPCQ